VPALSARRPDTTGTPERSRLSARLRGPLDWVVTAQRTMPARHKGLLAVLVLTFLSPYTAPVAMLAVVLYAVVRTVRTARADPDGKPFRGMVRRVSDGLGASRIFLPGAVLLVSAIAGAIVYDNPKSLLATFAVLLPAFLAALWYEHAWTRDDALHFSHYTSLLLLPIALIAVVRLAGVFPYTPMPSRATGTFGNPNILAMVLEALIPMAMAMTYHVWSKPGKALLLFAITVGWIMLYFTGSRSGMMAGLAAAMVFFLFMSERRFLSVAIGLTALGLIILSIWPEDALAMLKTLIPRLNTITKEITSRLALWKFAWTEILKDPVLGRGLFSFSRYITNPHYADRIHAHSLYIGLWLETGGIGLAAFVFLIVRFVGSVVRTFRGSPLRPYLAGGLAVLTTLLVHGVTDMPLMSTQELALILLTLSALSVALGPKGLRGGPPRLDSEGRRIVWALSLIP
jgi:O-antigen ligase